MMNKTLKQLTAFLAAGIMLCGCGELPGTAAKESAGAEPAQRTLFAMDTVMSLTAYGPGGEEAVQKAAEEIERLDKLLSTGDENSEISALNRKGSGKLQGDVKELVERSLQMAEETGGTFDIAIYPVMEAWGFTEEEQHVPDQEVLKELLPLCDTADIEYDASTGNIRFRKEGMKIDLGGVAKGYTSTRLMDIYKSCGVTSGLVNLGGNVQTLGTKPDGSLWRIAIEDPDNGEDRLGVLSIADKAAITSGGYERFFEADGQIFHHIIDPATGWPAKNGLKSVTIISADGTLADMLSTSLYIMGTEKAQQFCLEHAGSDSFDAVLYTDEDKLLITPGIEESFEARREVKIMEGF